MIVCFWVDMFAHILVSVPACISINMHTLFIIVYGYAILSYLTICKLNHLTNNNHPNKIM